MKLKPLNSVCEIFTGLAPRLKSEASARDTASIPVVGIRTITTDGALDLAQLEKFYTTRELLDPARALQTGDVVLSIRGSLPKTVLIEEEFSETTYASGNLAVLRPDGSKIDSAYLWSFMLRICRDTHHPLLTRATTQQLSIRVSDLASLKIPVFTLEVQRAVGCAAIALRNAICAQRESLESGDRTLRSFLMETFPTI